VASHGVLSAVTAWLIATRTRLFPSVDAALGLGHGITIAGVIGIMVLGLAGRARMKQDPRAWPWPITGLALGGVGLLAWVSESVAGWGWGLSTTGPSRSLIESALLGMPEAVGWGRSSAFLSGAG